MPKVKELKPAGLTQQVIYLNRTTLMKLKAYALEIDTPFLKLIEPEVQQFTQLLVNKMRQVDEMRMAAFEKERKERQEQALADQFPMKVTGQEVEPITKVETVAEAV